MIFHSTHTISIRRYSVMDATRDIRLVSRLPLPAWACKKAFEKLQVEVGLLFDKDVLDKDVLRLIMYNRITMYSAALLVMTYGKNEMIEKWYADTFGGEYNQENLKNEIDRIVHRYKELERKEPIGKTTFEDLISGVEVMLGYAINRENTLFEFKFLYDNAIKKNKNG